MLRSLVAGGVLALCLTTACGTNDAAAPASGQPAAAPGAPGAPARVEFAPIPKPADAATTQPGYPAAPAKAAPAETPKGGETPAPAGDPGNYLAPVEGIPEAPPAARIYSPPGPNGKRPPPVVPANP